MQKLFAYDILKIGCDYMKNLLYDVGDKVPFGKNVLFSIQQVLSIIVATILLPIIVDPSGVYLSQSAALIGAGVGTIVYLIITRFKSPVCLGSSFGFTSALMTALSFGYFGIFIGAIMAGFVYVVIAILIKFIGVNWINNVMPPIVIGPVVALIGFNLAGGAISNIMNTSSSLDDYSIVSILIGLFTFFVTIFVSVKGGKRLRFYPFLIGLCSGYIICYILTVFGMFYNIKSLQLVDLTIFNGVNDIKNWLPNFTCVGIIEEGTSKIESFGSIITIFTAFVPIAFVSFAEHIADHKNLSSIIGRDLLKDPGLSKTILGDGIGSMIGAFLGGCPNTTYGESIGCVALSKNASTRTIFMASILSIIIAFFYPFILIVKSIPSCVVGGISIALFGFISVSGLRMFKDVDLNDSKNLFVVASILISGIGGLFLKFGAVEISNIACALIVGIIANAILAPRKGKGVKISKKPDLLEGDQTLEVDDNSNGIKDDNLENIKNKNA